VTAPLVPLAATFAAGVWLGLRTPMPLWFLAPAGLAAGLGAEALRQRRLAAASAAALTLATLAGWARVSLPDPWPAITGLRAGAARIEGLVSADPETDGPRTRLPLLLRAVTDEAGTRPAAGRLAVSLYGPPPTVRPADRVRLTVTLSEARPFRNPGTAEEAWTPMPRAAHFLAIARADSLERLPPEPGPWWFRLRLWVHAVVTAHLPPVSGALFEGLLMGERRWLPPTLLADFRAAGVFHILAISGFNVGLVAAAVFLLLRLVRLPARAAAALALVTLGAFATVVGGEPSVLRATVMASLVLAGQLLHRESGSWNSLAAALLALLAWEPGTLLDPGLQLSFAATAGILHVAPPLREALAQRWPRPLAAAVAVSAGAQLAVTPPMLAHFGQVSLVGIGANLVVVPLAALVTTLGLLAVFVAVASDALAHLLFQSLWLCLLGLRLIVRAFALVPGAVIHAPPPPALAVVAAAGALLVAPHAARGRRRGTVLALTAFAVVATALGALPDGALRVLMLDVGQGDAIVVRGPDGQTLVVDTGGGGPGRADRGERVVLPVLRRLGVRRLRALAITHADPDHAGGIIGLLEGLGVDEVWIPAGTEAAWQPLLAAAGVAQRPLARGDRAWLGPVLVTALHPPRPGPGIVAPLDENNRSLVLRVDWGLGAVLLMGDAEAPAERDLLAAGLPLQASVLKVGHHGSRHASSAPFLAAVAPRLALISVGRRNPFGHPAPAALARLASAGAAVYRTDLDGAVEITTDGDRLRVQRWANPRATEEIPLTMIP
jgi:competence protein ComEC